MNVRPMSDSGRYQVEIGPLSACRELNISACPLRKRSDIQEHPEVLTVEAWRPYIESGPTPNTLLTKCLFLKDKKSRHYLVFALADSECDLKHILKEVKALFPVCAGCRSFFSLTSIDYPPTSEWH